MQRRSLILAPLGLAAGLAQSQGAWPTRPIRLIVPYAPGGGPDVLARKLADKLGPLLGQTVFVENRVGAGGVIAAEVVAQAEPDGYTLILGASTHVTQKLISPQVRFDPLTQFEHVTRTSISPAVLIVETGSPLRTVQELVEAARRAPGKLNYASGGIGSAAHLAGAALATALKLDVVHIPYRGSVEIFPSLVARDTQFGFPVSSTALPFVEQGKVRALAVTSARRMAQLPQVPTLKEVFGSDDLVLDAWSGLWAPAKTPRAVIDKLNAATLKALADPDLRQLYDKAGSPASPTRTPEEFSRFVLAETAKYAKLVVAARIVP